MDGWMSMVISTVYQLFHTILEHSRDNDDIEIPGYRARS